MYIIYTYINIYIYIYFNTVASRHERTLRYSSLHRLHLIVTQQFNQDIDLLNENFHLIHLVVKFYQRSVFLTVSRH